MLTNNRTLKLVSGALVALVSGSFLTRWFGDLESVPLSQWSSLGDTIAKLLTALAACSAVVTAIVAYRQYIVQNRSAAIQNEVTLANAFTDLLARADGRISTVVSDAAITKLFDTDLMKRATTSQEVRDVLQTAGVMGIGNGEAAQSAAIECVVYFGCSYEMLNAAAIAGLQRVRKYSPVLAEQADRAINKLGQSGSDL